MKQKIVFAILGVSLFAWGCTLFSQPFEGQWSASGSENNFSWYTTYTFKQGAYTISGYPPLSEKGTYTITTAVDQTFTLRLQPTQADPEKTEPYEIEMELSDDGQILQLGTLDLRKSK